MAQPSNRVWKIVGLSVLVLLLVAGGGWFALDRSSRAALDDARDRLAGAGLPQEPADLEAWIDARFGPCPAADNGAPALRAALAAVRDLDVPSWDREPGELPEPDDRAREFVAGQDENLARIARALDAPRFRFDIAWQDGLEAETPGWLGYQEALTLVTMRLAIRLEDGDQDRALDDLRLIAALGESLRECPRLVEQAVRIGVRKDVSGYLRPILERADDPLAVLEAVGLEPIAGGARLGLATEPAILLDAADDLIAAGDLPSLGGLIVSWFRRDLAHLVDHGIAVHGAAETLSGATLARIEEMEHAYFEGAGWLGGILATNASPWLRLELEQRAGVALTRAGGDVLAFRAREGRWPTLSDLRDVPVDPITGSSLTAEVDEDRLVLTLGDATWRVQRRR